ncbi:neuronal acetylcholine receptor subunit alpha-6-like [Asterias amurensis]|uniref:neuronal acetylcholine receptor subunit alpha-6-like n=1 Tax=Asterias amurensis TaxID=7602 RepID=UPI003AB3B15A
MDSCVTAIQNDTAAHGGGSSDYLAERRLRHVLMGHDDYYARERPVNVSSDPVNVNIKMVMYGLISLNEMDQIMKGASWLVMQWYDYRFQWNPEDFADMEVLSLRMDEIWTPKILLTNTANENVENPIRDNTFQVLTTHHGIVTLSGSIIHETTCLMDLDMFPFDKQECHIRFQTQNMPINLVHLHSRGSSLELFPGGKFHSQWEPLGVEGRKEIHTINDSVARHVKTYSRLVFTLKIKRIPTFYIYNIALPSCILTVITLFVFWLSPESGEKISLSISLMLGQAVFWLVVADALPPTGTSPLLSDSIRVNFIVGSLGIMLSVITVTIHHQVGTIKNRFLRKLFVNVLPRIVCLSPPDWTKVGDSSLRMETVRESKFTEGGSEANLSVISDQSGTSSTDLLKISPCNGEGEMKLLAATLDRIFFVITALIFIGGNVDFYIKATAQEYN